MQCRTYDFKGILPILNLTIILVVRYSAGKFKLIYRHLKLVNSLYQFAYLAGARRLPRIKTNQKILEFANSC